MAVLIDLILRESLFLVLLAALGAGPAAFLGDRFDRCARAAMAPVLGLCVGVCLTVTLVFWFRAHDTYFLLPVVALLSIAVAVWRHRRPWRRPSARSALQVAVIVVVVFGSFSYPLVDRGTVGPIGGYQISDTSGYLSETNGEQSLSIRDAEHIEPPYSNLVVAAWSIYSRGTQQLDVSALEANYNQLLGLDTTETLSPFLIAIIAAGALGVFAVVRRLRGEPTWAAVLAGCLFAGPMFVQLVMEGSQAALCGAAVMVPAVTLGVEAMRRPRPTELVLFGLCAAGLQTLYPLFIPCVAIGGAIVLGVMLIKALIKRTLPARALVRYAGALVAALAISAVLTPVAFARNAHYWLHVVHGRISFDTLPGYVLPGTGLPGWLLQTRDFYNLAPVGHGTSSQLLLSAVVPLLLLALIALGVWRDRVGRAMLAVAAGGVVLAYYTVTHDHCGYCEQRNLIPIAPMAATGIGLGLAALAGRRWRGSGWAAAGVALVVVLVVGHEGIVLRQRLTQSDYMLERGDRRVVHSVPSDPGSIELEGFSESGQAPSELPLVYNLLNQRAPGDVSLPTFVDDNSGLAYLLGGPVGPGPSFRPDYRYVLTRLAGVHTQRTTIARVGSIALQRRTTPLDVTPITGLRVAAARLDPAGTAWVAPSAQIQFLIVGGSPGQPAWVSLTFRATVSVTVPHTPGVVSDQRDGHAIRVCMSAVGTAPLREAIVQPQFAPQPPPAPPGRYDPPFPLRGLALTSMTVSTRSCAGTRHH